MNCTKEYKIIFPGYVKKGDSNLVTLVEEGDIETICTRYPYSLDW